MNRMKRILRIERLLFPDTDIWLKDQSVHFRRLAMLCLLSVASLSALTVLMSNVWLRMAIFYLVSCPLVIFTTKIQWADLVRPKWRYLAIGPGAAAVLYVLGWAGFTVLGILLPGTQEQTAEIYAWKDQISVPLAILLLVFVIIPGEEILWRGAVTVPLAAALGPIAGSVAGGIVFAIAHIATGSALIVMAALAMGTFWGLMTLRWRSLVPAGLCHLIWDLSVMFIVPY